MKNLLSGFPKTTKIVVLILLIASPWLIVQVGIFVLAPDKEFDAMPICADDSGNCAHLGGGDADSEVTVDAFMPCLLYTSPSPRD